MTSHIAGTIFDSTKILDVDISNTDKPNMIRFVSWGFGNDSTYLVESLINKGDLDFEVISSDPGQEMEYTYNEVIPFYKERWEKLGIKVNIISRDYDIYSHFWERNQVPLGIFNPYCSSHFKRDLIWGYYRERFGRKNKKGKKYLAGRFVKIVELIGHTKEEEGRLKTYNHKWLIRKYPNHENGITKPVIARYFKNNDLVEPRKSACWLCPNKPIDYFARMKKENPNNFQMLVDLEMNAEKYNPANPPTLKESGKLIDLVNNVQLYNQHSLVDFDYSELNCSEYCYT